MDTDSESGSTDLIESGSNLGKRPNLYIMMELQYWTKKFGWNLKRDPDPNVSHGRNRIHNKKCLTRYAVGKADQKSPSIFFADYSRSLWSDLQKNNHESWLQKPKKKRTLEHVFTGRWPRSGEGLTSVADPGCLSRIRLFSIPDPGSELSPSRIPDPHQRI